ncbi:TniQ family protein (plasmid) [Bradyrhizobium barranii subsp. barranii]|uniref:TniQ family protein n=1 Tax=Bradyrhizobium barranii subsp. barranii TaxID=2823807 RepID=A0A7Z0QMM3_9BRAD|nr:TniQ family protein [Bradyrhizobium barranii]UGX89677.1 TniQ family protein [Bradyrhizobium barranii subsp. barranii]
MSGETGFAIEIRERYQDVVADRWPAAPGPQPDELLSSWLHRLAIANGVAPRAFAGVLGLSGGIWSPRLDLRLPQDVATWLGARTGVTPEAISSMAMTDGALAPLLLPLRDTVRRGRSTWLQYCALCLADDRAPYFRRSWRLASRISCFRHGCGLRDRCPACRSGIAPFAQTDLIPQYVCVRCGFDLRGGAKKSVEAAARRLERSIDDICKAEIAKSSSAIHEWVARLLRVPVVAGVGSGRPLANLSASTRIRCFELLAQRADDGLIAAAFARPRQPTLAAGGRDGLIARFVDFIDARQRAPRSARAQPPGVDLAALLAAYARAVGRRSRSKLRGGDLQNTLAVRRLGRSRLGNARAPCGIAGANARRDCDALTRRPTPDIVRGP